ncbi:MAG: aminopeptidase P family N-terminal domain-containing protein, partial [Streptococcaceae bacterium]|nr:aminopeptidase P family N-terminal domain-containing protein [Streptococcaceae bacterium]
MNNKKIKELRDWMNRNEVDCVYLSDPTHISYFSGFSSAPHERVLALFLTLEAGFLFTPALEVEEAERSTWSGPVYGYLDSENPWQSIANSLAKLGLEKGRFAIEKSSLSVDRFEQMA